MGCDIHGVVQTKTNGQWKTNKELIFNNGWKKSTFPFDYRSYALFGFLSDVRNMSNSESFEDKGFPDDFKFTDLGSEYEECDESWYHSKSYIGLNELLAFDYEKIFYDERSKIKTNYKDFLCDLYFENLEIMKSLGEPNNVRIVFCFDN